PSSPPPCYTRPDHTRTGAAMLTRNFVLANRYQDSVTLMQVAGRARAVPGVADAALLMGTVPNKELLADAGLLTAEGQAAGPNDLIVAVQGSAEAIAAVEQQLEELLRA